MIASIEKETSSDYAKKAVMKLIKDLIQYIDVEKMTPFVKKQLLSTLSKIEMKTILEIISRYITK